MPNGRPGTDTRRTREAKRSGNPFSAWMESRRERQREMEESVAKKVTNETAHNEALIIDELSNIDFSHSRLSKKDLEHKSNPKQPCGDLEYASRSMQQLLLKDPQTIQMDIRKIDEKLLTLAMLFRQAVEQGDRRAAYAAKGALARGLKDIRTRIPQKQPELAQQFVDLNAKYLEDWITLVKLAQAVDRTKQNADNQRATHEQAMERDQRKLDEIEDMLKKDPEKGQAFTDILHHSAPEDRAHWTEAQRSVHGILIDQRLSQVKLALSGQLLEQQEEILSAKENQVDTLYIKVAALPLIEDPDLMNKYAEQMDELFHELAESDAEIDEILKTADEIEGRLKMLENAPGSMRGREVATEQAQIALDRIKKKQEDYVKSAQGRNKDLLEELGLETSEKLEERRRQVEEQEQRDFQAEEEFEEEGELLYE